MYDLPVNLPVLPISVALYATFLDKQGYSSSSITSAMSVISFVHKCKGFVEPNKTFIVQQALKGIRNNKPCRDNRLPITKDLLHKLCNSLQHIQSSPRVRAMLKSMYLLAFYAFLRVGEFTLSHGNHANVLQLQDVLFEENRYVTMMFSKFKHSKNRKCNVNVYAQSVPYCPVQSLHEYMYYRGRTPGPLYVTHDGVIVTREWFASCLKQSVQFLKLDTTMFKSHSFRIGAASYAAMTGMSDSQIRIMGRWNSNVFLRYIRLG